MVDMKPEEDGRQDVISELEFLAGQHAILTFTPEKPTEILAEELYERDGELQYNLENLSIAEYNEMLKLEKSLKAALLKPGHVSVIGEEERKKLPEELIRKINLYARKGKSVLDLSGKRYVVMADLEKERFTEVVKFLKDKQVPEEFIRRMLPRAFGERIQEQSLETVLQNFKAVKNRLSPEDLDEFYRIYEEKIEHHDREKLRDSVECLESMIEGSPDFGMIEQAPFDIFYVHNKQNFPAKWSTASCYSIDDKMKAPVTIDLLQFDKIFAIWFMKSLVKRDYASIAKGAGGKFIKLKMDGRRGMVKQVGNNVVMVTVPESYSDAGMERAEGMAERSLKELEKPFEIDFIPYHLSIPAGYMPILGRLSQRQKKRERAENRITELFGKSLLKPAEERMKSEDHTKDEEKPYYNGIHTTLFYPFKSPERKRAIAEIQSFTWLGYIDQSEEGRAPHDPYKENRYQLKGKKGELVEIPELFPTKLGEEGVDKRNEYYLRALQRQIKEFKELLEDKKERFLEENPNYDPKDRFVDLVCAYAEHITDPNASGELKTGLKKEVLPLLFELPVAYMMGANIHNLSERKANLEKMKSELDLGMKFAGYKFEKKVLDEYDKSFSRSARQNLFDLSEVLASELYKKTAASDDETRLKRFILSSVVSRLIEDMGQGEKKDPE
ncbi:hypothetical protein JXB11_03815, partial [Candidatus Woesearchaeota archaeon]|nr:hypothetical protein [Candidatus Woesearchaeota archaeon]